MSRFPMRLAFCQFRKNCKNRLNFKDAVVRGWGRLEENEGNRFWNCHR